MKTLLQHVAHARSGDKGDTANVGVIAWEPRWYPLLARLLTQAEASFRAARAGSTLRAYEHDWRQFRSWCQPAGLVPLPAPRPRPR